MQLDRNESDNAKSAWNEKREMSRSRRSINIKRGTGIGGAKKIFFCRPQNKMNYKSRLFFSKIHSQSHIDHDIFKEEEFSISINRIDSFISSYSGALTSE